ncbi:hypothetical protein I5Q82_16265 [Acutalibacter muris]|uniref:Large polyvalent protein-associated domain-containing protein n=1 Tax=Acutalibacter muris TaxID=1796620 RepID=A0A1Z2XPC0_9FIRM|nr:LPD11 domain-containing protein [Acutalibacter muris]ARE60567.1 hypothetical protein A4V00_19340 [Hungateiclostridiaceae bacterium KB18]ASB40280.1 hypothetical protein ADH66_06175 [Acutalibacter muris]QQR29570.1 hypothetical protein I5Q82_16265 [Acutalibacter muris]
MKSPQDPLTLTYIGDDSWSRPVYRAQFQHLWKDTDCGRLRCDCDYYLGYGNRNEDILCGTPQEHIECMKKRWLEFADDEKPEWLTWEQILEYERQMCTTPDKT